MGEFGITMMIAGNIPGRTQTVSLAIWDAVMAGHETRAAVLALALGSISLLLACYAALSRAERPTATATRRRRPLSAPRAPAPTSGNGNTKRRTGTIGAPDGTPRILPEAYSIETYSLELEKQ